MSFLRRIEFSLWYLGSPPWDTGSSPPELRAFLEEHEPGRAIDLGCGTGTNVVTMAQSGWQVLGVDFAPGAIRRARRKMARAALHADLRLGDVTELRGVAGPVDFALDLGCFHGLPPLDKRRYLDRLLQLLKPGGYWMVYGRLQEDPRRRRFGITAEEIKKILARFELVSRQDGFNRGRSEPATYLLLRKPGA